MNKRKRVWNGRVPLVLLGLTTAFAAGAVHPLAELTGGRARLVWVQDRSPKCADVGGRGNQLWLMGLDTGAGERERPLVGQAGNFVRPMLTPDGKRVVYSDRRDNKIYVVGWDGGKPREVGTGLGFDVWRDPGDGRFFVVYQVVKKGRKQEKNPVRIRPLDGKGPDRLLWNRTPVTPVTGGNFQLSRDGSHACGLFPWPHGGVAELPNKNWEKLGTGCWVSLAPDNSYLFWIFDGPHRDVYMSARDGRRWKVPIAGDPYLRGFEVYHPRWSNHVRYLCITGPYLGKGGKPGGNRIGQGGKEVEVLVGRFAPDFQRVEKWLRVTHNAFGDFFPDLWVDGGDKSRVPRAVCGSLDTLEREAIGKFRRWPGTQQGLVFLWNNSKSANTVMGPDGKPLRSCRVHAVRKAVFGRFYDMLLGGGAMLAEGVDRPLLEACKKSNRLAVEALLTPDDLNQHGPARIVSFSQDPNQRNFTLGQDGKKLIFRLRTPKTGPNGTNPEVRFGSLQAGKPTHVIVAYRPGRLAVYIDGRPISVSQKVSGDFRNWAPMHLLFGDEWTADRDWRGRLEAVAIYARFIGPEEAAARYRLLRPRLEKRKPLPRLVVEARLVAKSRIPAPAAIAPYRRCLALEKYKIVKVIDGTCNAPAIAVARWVILDGRKLPGNEQTSRPWKVRRLVLEPFDAHPELQGERLVNDLDDFDLEQYFDPRRSGE